jgi:hypothetical protein
MATKTDPARLDDAIQRYLAGEEFEKIEAATGVGQSVFNRERRRRSIPPRRFLDLPMREIVNAYQAGESTESLARRHGVTPRTIALRLDKAGIARRTGSEAQINRHLNPDTRSEERLSRYRKLLRRTESDQRRRVELERLAAHREASRFHSFGEQVFCHMLRQRGFDPIPQQSVGRYNVDLAVHPVAVEILGGRWHTGNPKYSTRTPYVLNQGWNLAFVWCRNGERTPGEGAAGYVAALVDQMRRQPPTVCQYWVISGDGELLATGSADDDQFTLIPPPRRRHKRRP